jgi:hypothetical protein
MRYIWILCAAALASCADVRPVDESADDLNAIAEATSEPTLSGIETGNGPDAGRVGVVQDGMEWLFATDATGPRLAYGEPGTDNVRLMLRCADRGAIRLSFLRPEGTQSGEFVLRSEGAERRVYANAEETELGAVNVVAVMPVDARPLQSFRAGSPVDIQWQGEVISLPGAGEEARRLFEACRASG